MRAERHARRAQLAAKAARAEVEQARAEQRRSRARQDPWRLPPGVPTPADGGEGTGLGPAAEPS
eukprot:9815556-Alexandrium_andersonii.AAC.1